MTMSKKKRSPTKKPNNTLRSSSSKPKPLLKRRTLIKLGVGSLLSIPAFMAFSAYVDKQNARYDLAGIGQGKPVLVQVHDPQCPKCRKLLSSVESVLHEFPQIDFRIAAIKSPDGRRFASKHKVAHVSLVMLDGEGKRLDSASGLQQPGSVRSFISQSLEKY